MGPYRTELRALVALAFPIISGHLAQMLVGLVDTIMVGPLGADATAAVGLSMAMAGLFLILGFGLCVPVHVFVSAAHAANQPQEAARVLFHGLFITGIFSVALGALTHANIGLLDHIGQDPAVVKLAKPFVILVMWSAVPVMAGACLRNYCEARGRPWVPFLTLAVMLPINVGLNWLLIYGKWGFPQMGVSGAAMGTLLARTAQVAMLAVFVARSKELRPTGEHLWRMRWERLRNMLGVGLPSSVQIFAEAGAFSLMAVFAGLISAKAQAAYQICNILGSLSFMVPMGLGMATTIRIGYAFGRRDAEGLRRVRTLAYALITVFMGVYAAAVIFWRHAIPHAFTEDTQVIAIASACLVWTGLFAVSDGTQAIGIALSRGLRDVKVPSAAAALTYWLIALPLGWTLAFHAGLGAPGLWMGLAVALTFITFFLFFRVRKNLRRYVSPESFTPKAAQTAISDV